MATRKRQVERPDSGAVERIKSVAIAAMFSDDWLMEQLVLKGGNAMDLVLQVHSRASIDLDFSLATDLDVDVAKFRIESALATTFSNELGYRVFDFKMVPSPKPRIPDELEFWGGYDVEFKLIAEKRAAELESDVERMRGEAVWLGQGPRFLIDISRHEYVNGKVAHAMLGYRIFVYSPAMIVAEKVRAICQQMSDYAAVVLRTRSGSERARDFVDIEVLVGMFGVDFNSASFRELVAQMFEAKRVPLKLIENIAQDSVRDMHALGFKAVRDTMKPGVALEGSFDHYHRFVVEQCAKLETFWNV